MASAGFIGAGTARRRRRGVLDFITAALTYTRGTPDVLKMQLASASGGTVGSALDLTTLKLIDAADLVGVDFADWADIAGTDVLAGIDGDAVSPQLASDETPGSKTATGAIISAMSGAAEVGTLYAVDIEITAFDPGATLYFPAGAGSPFPSSVEIPVRLGVQTVLVTAEDTDTTAAVRSTGNITVSAFSIRKAEWSYDVDVAASAGDAIVFAITRGDATPSGATIVVPVDGEFYVASTGSDTTGSGAEASPFKTISAGVAAAADVGQGTVYIRPGTYDGARFEDIAGTTGNHIILTTKVGEENQAIVQGDLASHIKQGGTGSGVPEDYNDNDAKRDGLRFTRCEYITVKNLSIQDFWGRGIAIIGGTHGTTYEEFVIQGNQIDNTGSSSILIQGKPGTDRLLNTETTAFLSDITINQGNICTQANQPNDYFNHIDGVVGSDTECLSVVWGVDGIDVDGNQFLNGANYGVDFKAGVKNFTFTDNTVSGFRKYGVYLDTANLWLEDGEISGNTIDDAQIGIAMSREAADLSVYADYAAAKAALGGSFFQQSLVRVDVFNNTAADCDEAGIRLERHPTKDGPDGEITDVRIRYNTFYNNNRDGTAKDAFLSGWSDADFLSANITTGFDFIGNVISNDTADIDVTDDFTGETGFTLRHNHGLADGAETDPLFVDAPNGDFTPDTGSPLIGLVTTSGDADSPFNTGTRVIPSSAGAVFVDVADFSLISGDGEFTINGFVPDPVPFVVTAGDGSITITWSGGMLQKYLIITTAELSGTFPEDVEFMIAEGTSPMLVALPNDTEVSVAAIAQALDDAFKTVTPVGGSTVITVDDPAYADFPMVVDPDLNGVGIVLSGTYTGDEPTDIQARILDASDSSQVQGLTPVTILTAAAGAWTGTIDMTPGNAAYLAEVRVGAAGDSVVQTLPFRTAGVLASYGQSNTILFFDNDDLSVTARSDTFHLRNSVFGAPEGGMKTLLNELAVASGISWLGVTGGTNGAPIGALDNTLGGEYDQSTAPLDNFRADLTTLTARPTVAVFHQGEGNVAVAAGQPVTDYETSFDDIWDTVAGDFSAVGSDIPKFIPSLATWGDGPDDVGWSTVDQWHLDLAATKSDVYWGGSWKDARRLDNYHGYPSDYTRRAKRTAEHIKAHFGLTSPLTVFQIGSVEIIDGTTTDVTVVHGQGTAMQILDVIENQEAFGSNTTEVRGFEVASSASYVAATGTIIDATTIRLTHADIGTVSRNLRYLYGSDPDTSGMVLDNSTAAVPLLHTANTPIVATGAVAAGLTLAESSYPMVSPGTVETLTVTPTLTAPDRMLVAFFSQRNDRTFSFKADDVAVTPLQFAAQDFLAIPASNGGTQYTGKDAEGHIYLLDIPNTTELEITRAGGNMTQTYGVSVIEAKGSTGSWSVLDVQSKLQEAADSGVLTHAALTVPSGDGVAGLALGSDSPTDLNGYVDVTGASYSENFDNTAVFACSALGSGVATTYGITMQVPKRFMASIVATIEAA